MRVLAPVLALLVLVPCSCKASQPPTPAASGAPTLAGAGDPTGGRFPIPGRAKLEFSGGFSRKIEGLGGDCWDWDSEQFGLYVRSSDVEGVGSRPAWFLSVGRFGSTGADVTLTFRAGDKIYRAAERLPSAGTLSKTDSGVLLNASLRAEVGSESVQVVGAVDCPRYPTGITPGPEIAATLARLSGAAVRTYSTFDFGRAKDHSCISVVVPEDKAESIVRNIRSRLPHGWIAFIGTNRWLGEDRHEGVEVVVGPGRDQYDALRLARSDAMNYDMGTEALVRQLRSYDELYGLSILRAETDTIEVELTRLPDDVPAFAEDVARFCPDIVEQGTGTTERLASAIRDSKRVFLWWD